MQGMRPSTKTMVETATGAAQLLAAGQGDTHTLKWKLKEGDVFYNKMTVTMDQTIEVMPKSGNVLTAVGAIAGVTTVLNDYWATSGGQFPFPSMVGSGDRMSIA